MNPEQERIAEAEQKEAYWAQWGPYLSERQWGTVREDYSASGDAWNYFPFEQAASRAYRWGEDGIGGVSDNHQKVCFSFAFWNEKDPCLKERFFGLTNGQGNHGEDVKEYYYYLDNTPSHSYMRMLYKYPQGEFPYQKLLDENRQRGLRDYEYELIDTGIFDENRYFDVFLEYAKNSPDDLLIKATVWNRGPDEARIHVLPHLWLRNVWSWKNLERPEPIRRDGASLVLEDKKLYFEGTPETLFTENETNFEKLFGTQNQSHYVKDAFHEAVVHGNKGAVNPQLEGTKASLHYVLTIPPGGSATLRLRFAPLGLKNPFADFEAIFTQRQEEADTFYRELIPCDLTEERRNIQRQAFAGLLWNKQFYHYVVEEWLEGDNPLAPPPASRKQGRNAHWKHVYSEDIFSMPDTWEYPWFASWDLAFHAIPLALVDPAFAKRQLSRLNREWYMHPDGQIPAYEWDFEDVNPPVLAWAAWRVFKIEQRKHGKEDRAFLEQIFQKLVMNFTWWVNRKDQQGRNVFEGGFLGLDNISIFNRSEPLPLGGELTQSDATSWMAMFCLNMWTIAVELAIQEPIYEDMASKFFKHFLYIADAINFEHPDSPPLWNEEDGFYYDLLKRKDGSYQSLNIRSMVGLIPLFAVATLDKENLEALPEFKKRFEWFLAHRSNLCVKVSPLHMEGLEERRLLSLLSKEKLQRILEKMLDEKEFLSPHGIRSLSRVHAEHPFTLACDGMTRKVDYEPAESTSRLYGGNSNWRGPVWFPLNYLIIESLQKYHHYYGDDFTIECPTGSGHMMTLVQVADELSRRLISLFEKDAQGNRPIHGGTQKFQTDPHFKDHLLYYEYFHGDNGAGLGASHQTGWTALVAKLIQQLK
jgi:hypothetical protein